MLSLFDEIKTHKFYQIDTSILIDHVYNEIVTVLSNAANAYIPTYRTNFLKFWWNEELTALKAYSVESNFGRQLANHDQVKFLRNDKHVVLGIVRLLKITTE